MSRLTVKEYATLNKVSVQSVYKRIKSGALDVIEVDNIKYVLIQDSIDYEKKFNDIQLKYNSLIELNEFKDLIIDGLKEQIKLYQLILPKPKNVEVIEVENDSTSIKQKKKEKKDKKKDKRQKKKDKKNRDY